MKIGLVGYGGAGKSTVFSALTGIDPSSGRGGLASIRVPDQRVDALAQLCRPRKTTYAEITFQDFPSGAFAPRGRSLGGAILGEMRTLDVLAEVCDAFSQPLESAVQTVADFRAELLLSDLAIVERRLERLARERGDPGEQRLLERVRRCLEEEQELRVLGLTQEEQRRLSGYRFLTLKPRILVLNVSEEAVTGGPGPLAERAADWDLEVVVMSAPIERELAELAPQDARTFLDDIGLDSGARDRFIAACYRKLDLITFLTAGEDEVRAWPVRRGTSAVEAAAKVHSDIARGFIRAEVVRVEDYLELGGEGACRKAGKLAIEGRDYQVRDGDVIHFRFNV
ncbi:MAG: redox-regulated ATPase YchF [Candidatus Dadabacteria bacterium]|nr:MAG: redox-regulated ATPase YchF [Candidatus Dadabacteria bacterium]